MANQDFRNLTDTIKNLTSTVHALQAALSSEAALLAAAADPCAAPPAPYDTPFHLAAVFIILVCSTLGVALTLLGKHLRFMRLRPYFLLLGKTVGTGILIACALVHLLSPASQSLTSSCVPVAFNTTYPAYAFLFCMLAFLGMQLLEIRLNQHMCGRASAPQPLAPPPAALANLKTADVEAVDAAALVTVEPREINVLNAFTTEFAFDVHSVIIGLTTGCASNAGVRVLVCALAFHQCFEGVALGARLMEAAFPPWLDAMMAATFALAAPVGIAVGVAVLSTASLSVDSATFLLTQGTLDAVTSGVLLHIGAAKLLRDFPADLDRVGAPGAARPRAARGGLYFALSLGAGFMAYIGKYL